MCVGVLGCGGAVWEADGVDSLLSDVPAVQASARPCCSHVLRFLAGFLVLVGERLAEQRGGGLSSRNILFPNYV